jgi:hypothetical protein
VTAPEDGSGCTATVYSPKALLSLLTTLLPLKPSMRMLSLAAVMVVRPSAHIGSAQLSVVKGSGAILALLLPAGEPGQ